jgi:two-component system LytT family response regulator
MIHKECPEIKILHKANSLSMARVQLRELDSELMFVDVDSLKIGDIELVSKFVADDFEVIFVTKTPDRALEALKCGASGYITKPIRKEDLIRTIASVVRKIRRKEEENRNKELLKKLTERSVNDRILGIPTLEGFEFLHIENIIRCEGLQKCTRIITTEKTDVISSYNIGEFRKLLEPFGFFSPHKSHLINLKYIRKYHREGDIIMLNGSRVPVAKRKKKDFLDQFSHI